VIARAPVLAGLAGLRRPAAVATVGLVVALLLPAAWSGALADALTPPASRVDDRVVVVAFDDRAPESGTLLPIPHRRGVYLRDATTLAERAGAAAVVLVGFDSLALREGASDREAVAGSDRIQRLDLAPLLEVTLDEHPGAVPRAARYRVDELAGEFAGIGLPLVTDGPVVRTVPELAGVPTLKPDTVVRTDQTPTAVVYGLTARAALQASGSGPGTASADRIELAGSSVPLEDGRLRVRWTRGLDAPDDPAVVSAGRIIGLGQAPAPEAWAGKVVLIGTTDPAHTPYYDTPIGPLPELLVHANALNTLLTREYLQAAPVWVPLLVAVVLVIGVAALGRWRWWAAVPGALVAAGAWLLLVQVLASRGWLLEPLRPAAGAAATAVAVAVTLLVEKLVQRRRLARLFSEYVPADVARDLVESGRAETAQAGERLLVTVLFCDLRGFTPIAARLAPADVRLLLDTYYEHLSQIVFGHGGTVLQYTGDEIFAVFGAPVPHSDHADAALACAAGMRAALPALNAELAELGLPGVAYGIGLHTGLVVAAHVGSSVRRQYSIIGDAVNVGSRLCSQAREHQIVFSRALADHLNTAADADPLGDIPLKGVAAPMPLYRLRDDLLAPSTTKEIP
jgi:adenylate cyclase